MKRLLITIIGVFFNLMVFSQKDTIVRTNNIRIAGTITEITPYSVIIETSQAGTQNRIEIGHHLIAYVKYSTGETSKFRYNKWLRKSNTNILFKNGFYFDFLSGYCHYRRTGWNTDPITSELHFTDKRENRPRIGFNIGNRWSIYIKDSYCFAIGIEWINLSFSPDNFNLLKTVFYSDWIFTSSILNPEFTNIFLLNKKSALEHSFGGGYMYHLGEETKGYCFDSSLKFRCNKFAVGLGYFYGKTKDGGYGFPITLNTVNLSLGFKF